MITSENYVANAKRTDCEYNDELKERLVNCARLLHSAIGIATESGEFLDILKKHIFYGKKFDKVNAVEENGDLLWYIALALDDMSVTMNAVMTQNINKLKLRYPNKFNGKDAINRDVEAERVLLEQGTENNCIYGNPECKICNQIYNPVYGHECKIEKQSDENVLENKYSKRGQDWIKFAAEVLTHIETYTVPQYGDAGEDQVTNWTAEDCLLADKKYKGRFQRNVRPGEQERDFFKMAHFIQLAATKFQEESK